mmetsp:Transcript_105596/g.251698  ORF Transcript_105596/g.251698 Transcript_105596/m.251698 type:complete len:277 (-) Transcript_105596:630-1460(-)
MATMGTPGRRCDSSCAVRPVAVKTTMPQAPSSFASCAADCSTASVASSDSTSSFCADCWACACSMTRRCMVTASHGYCPTADSPLSITASQPSRMALATSLHSARVGIGLEIMDSSICVATMTGFPRAWACVMMLFCTKGTSSGFISTPRSPLATMTPSQAFRMLSRSVTAEGFSIFARSLTSRKPSLSTISRSSSMSPLCCTKDMPIQSTPCLQANLMSSRSLGVIGDMGRITSGVFTPFLPPSFPGTVTSQSTKGVAFSEDWASSSEISFPSSK